jgi:hypothetical protein
MATWAIKIERLGPGQFKYTDQAGNPAAEKHTKGADQELFRWCTDQNMEVELKWPNGHPFVRTPPGQVPGGGCGPGGGSSPVKVRHDVCPGEYKYDVLVKLPDGSTDEDDPKIIIDDVRDKWKLILLLAGAGLGAWLMWRHFRRKG